MALPLMSDQSAPHGSKLVFHPEIPPHEVQLAQKAERALFAAAVLSIGQAIIVVLTVYFAVISEEQRLLMIGLLFATSIGYVLWLYFAAIKPYMFRRTLLRMRSALWLAPGRTRLFYESYHERIRQYVDAHHQHRLWCQLHTAVRQMIDQERIADGDDSLLMSERTETTSDEARAEYDRIRDHVKAEIDKYVFVD